MPDPLHIPRNRLFIIAGPCVIESLDLCLTVARRLREICAALDLPFIFKASFDKANRSSASSFRGPGLAEGLKILAAVKQQCAVPILTDIHEPNQPAEAAKVVDVLQVPAFLARQTDLLVAAARTGRWVNVKKGQFMSPQEMKNAVDKVRSAGNPNVMLTERGTFFGYNRLVNDFTALPVMQSFGVPVVFDVTHSTQQPGGLGTASGGNPQFVPLLTRAAVAAGVDGLFIETHPDPPNAKSDAASVYHLDKMPALLTQAKQLADLRANWRQS